MTLILDHFDTKLRVRRDDLKPEQIQGSMAEYLFPDVKFSLGIVYEEGMFPSDLRPFEGMSAEFSSGDRVYFASVPVGEQLFPTKSHRAAYGSLPFTPVEVSEHTVRMLVVDDVTGENGGVLPTDVARSLVGDSHGKVLNADMQLEITGTDDTPFQFRFGIKPQEGNNVYRIGKGTFAPFDASGINELQGYDLIVAASSFKGRSGDEAISPGEHNLTVGIGLKTLAYRSLQRVDPQISNHYYEGVKADFLPILEKKAKDLATARSDPRKLALLYIKDQEERLVLNNVDPGSIKLESENIEFTIGSLGKEQVSNSDDEESAEDKEKDEGSLPSKNEILLYKILKADLAGHCQLLEHEKIRHGLAEYTKRKDLEIATGRAIKFDSALALPSLALKPGEVCVPWQKDGENIILYRSPVVNSNGVLVVKNKHIPELMWLKGSIHVNPETNDEIRAAALAMLKQKIEDNNRLFGLEKKLSSVIKREVGEDLTNQAVRVANAILNSVKNAILEQPSIDFKQIKLILNDSIREEVASDGGQEISDWHLSNISNAVLEDVQSIVKSCQMDFDGDRAAVALASKYPTLAKDIIEHNRPENRYPDIEKRRKNIYSQEMSFEEIALEVRENKVGLIANQIQKTLTLMWDVELKLESERAEFLEKMAAVAKDLLSKEELGELFLPLSYILKLDQVANYQEIKEECETAGFTSSSVDEFLGILKSVLFDVISDLDDELQVAVDGFKSSDRPNLEVLDYCNELTNYQDVLWLKERKAPDIYVERPLPSNTRSPVDLMIAQANDYFEQSKLQSRPTIQFRTLFPANTFTTEQKTQAEAIRDTYNAYVGKAIEIKDKLRNKQELGPSMVITSPHSGKQLLVTNLLYYDRKTGDSPVWQALQLDIKIVPNKLKNNPRTPHEYIAAVVKDKNGQEIFKPIGTITAVGVPKEGQMSWQPATVGSLKANATLTGGQVELHSGVTKQTEKAAWAELAQYVESVRANIPPEQHLAIASALWDISHTPYSNNNAKARASRAEELAESDVASESAMLHKRASAGFIFAERVVHQLRQLQFTTLTAVKTAEPSNEHLGRTWVGESVPIEVVLPTDPNHPFIGHRVLTVEGKALGIYGQDSPQLPIGTKATGIITSSPGSSVIATTAGGKQLKIERVKNNEWADKVWQGEQRDITIAIKHIPGNRGGYDIALAVVEGKVVGQFDRRSNEILRAGNKFVSGTVIPGVKLERPSPNTAVVIQVDPTTVVYPETWTKDGRGRTAFEVSPEIVEPIEEWERELIEESMWVLNEKSANPEIPFQLAYVADNQFAAVYSRDKETLSLVRSSDILDRKNIVYQARKGEAATVLPDESVRTQLLRWVSSMRDKRLSASRSFTAAQREHE